VKRIFPLEHMLGQERVLLERVDAVCQSIGERGNIFPSLACELANRFSGLRVSAGDFFDDLRRRGSKRGSERELNGFSTLGTSGEEMPDVGQWSRGIEGEIEGGNDDNYESGKVDQDDREVHRNACAFRRTRVRRIVSWY
jgi:hypothetical protein